MIKNTLTITLSDEDLSKLEEIRRDSKYLYCSGSKSNEIAWLIKQEWERVQEEKREKTPAELVAYARYYTARLEAQAASRRNEKAADHAAPCNNTNNTRIIPFPVRQIGQFSGNA
jgi:hypothetical protein